MTKDDFRNCSFQLYSMFLSFFNFSSIGLMSWIRFFALKRFCFVFVVIVQRINVMFLAINLCNHPSYLLCFFIFTVAWVFHCNYMTPFATERLHYLYKIIV